MRRIPVWPAVLAFGTLLPQPLLSDRAPKPSTSAETEWAAYERELLAEAAKHAKEEYWGIWKSGGRYHRELLLWLKASPPYRKNGAWARKVTVFVDDTSGHRIRTAPDEVLFEVKPPARVVGVPRRSTSNGQATAEILYGAGQDVASVSVKAVPEWMLVEAKLPLATLARPIDAAMTQQQWKGERPVQPLNESGLAFWLRESHRAEAEGERNFASAFSWKYGMQFLRANEFQKALDAFAACESKYQNARWAALCAYSQVVTLRRAGKPIEANAKARELMKKYPDSIPARFAVERPGEVWVIPHF